MMLSEKGFTLYKKKKQRNDLEQVRQKYEEKQKKIAQQRERQKREEKRKKETAIMYIDGITNQTIDIKSTKENEMKRELAGIRSTPYSQVSGVEKERFNAREGYLKETLKKHPFEKRLHKTKFHKNMEYQRVWNAVKGDYESIMRAVEISTPQALYEVLQPETLKHIDKGDAINILVNEVEQTEDENLYDALEQAIEKIKEIEEIHNSWKSENMERVLQPGALKYFNQREVLEEIINSIKNTQNNGNKLFALNKNIRNIKNLIDDTLATTLLNIGCVEGLAYNVHALQGVSNHLLRRILAQTGKNVSNAKKELKEAEEYTIDRLISAGYSHRIDTNRKLINELYTTIQNLSIKDKMYAFHQCPWTSQGVKVFQSDRGVPFHRDVPNVGEDDLVRLLERIHFLERMKEIGFGEYVVEDDVYETLKNIAHDFTVFRSLIHNGNQNSSKLGKYVQALGMHERVREVLENRKKIAALQSKGEE